MGRATGTTHTSCGESNIYCKYIDCRHYEQSDFFGCHGFCWYWEKWMPLNHCFCTEEPQTNK